MEKIQQDTMHVTKDIVILSSILIHAPPCKYVAL